MPKNTVLRLGGYFDRNFGDDYMFKLVVRNLPEVTFYADAREQDAPCLAEEPNVRFGTRGREDAPLLTVIGSGFMVNRWIDFLHELKWLLQKREVGDYCLGCNIEPFRNRCFQFVMKHKLRRYRMITCRDQSSFRWLKQHCITPEMHYAPDILFSLPDEWLPAERTADHLGISVMNLGEEAAAQRYYDCLAQVADHYIALTGRGVIFLAFDSGMEDDVSACRWVRDRMRLSERAEIVAHHRGGEIFQAFARCEKIIALRFHSAVLSMRMGIDAYPIVYREKMRNLLKDMGYPRSGKDWDQLDPADLCAFVTQPQQPYQLSPEIHERAKQHVQHLKAVLEKDGER